MDADFNTAYEVTASNATCTSEPASFEVEEEYPDPEQPDVSVTLPTCDAPGTAELTNYDPNHDYTFDPTGPSINTSGEITGAVYGTEYEVMATNTTTTCTSIPSAAFTIEDQHPTPAVPTIDVTDPTCEEDGYATITDYDSDYSYTFDPAGPTVSSSGEIMDAALSTLHTK
ncbi:MAG: hypothetical protein U5L09_12670 [Bacteroidales bacterium]|nr:hypothetical protein [Bacteroidales bacterium]